jgi:hypothetical protein
MKKLESIQGELLSKILKEVSPIKYESNRQANKLLDGSYHVQVIGLPLRSIGVTIISTYLQVERLNYLIDRGSDLVLYHRNKRYIIYINEPIEWNRINYGGGDHSRSFYEGRTQMIIKEEIQL